jgi:transposase-like protein
MSGKKGMKHYPVETKLEAVRLFVEEGKMRAAIAERLGCSSGRVKKWVSQYRHEENAFQKAIGRPRQHPESEPEELKRLRMENDLLKKFHTELRKEMLAKRNIGSSSVKGKNTR